MSAVPYCGAPPVPQELWLRWNPDPFAWAVLALIAGGYVAFRRRAGQGAFTEQARWFWLGWLALGIALVSPLCAWTSALFSVRAAHHLVLILVAAPLLAVGGVRLGTRTPLGLAAVVQAAVVWIWHAPPAYSAALSNDLVYWTMQSSLFLSALVFWSAVAAPRSHLAAAGGLAISMVQMGLLGALLTFAPVPLYAPHFASTTPWGLTPLEDQQLAGLIMWAPGALPYLVGVLAVVARMLQPSEPARA